MLTLHHQAQAAEVPEWMRFTVTVLVGLAIYTTVMFVQHLRAFVFAGHVEGSAQVRRAGANGIVTVACSFLIGVIVVWWLASAGMTRDMVFVEGGKALTDLDTGSRLLLALGISSIAPVVAQFIKARDNADSAKTPKLIP